MNKTTTAVKAKDIQHNWHFIDAKDQTLGKIAESIARILMGKNKATFSRHINVGDKVVVINAEKITVTGKKMNDKLYIWYTGFPGGLRMQKLWEKLEKNPTSVLGDAVKGMLPKNRLQQERMNNLFIYVGEQHPHIAQQKSNEKKNGK
jgi:large subunit ribosomal protein L13